MSSEILGLGNRIKRLRKQRHLTLEQLAEKVDVTLNFIQTTESGRNTPGIELFVKIVEALDVQPSQLLYDDLQEIPSNASFNDLSLSEIRLVTATATTILTETIGIRSDLTVDIGKRIHEYRLKANLSRKELAYKMGISADQLRKIEVGITSTTLNNLKVATETLNIPLEYMLQDGCFSANKCVLNDLLTSAKSIFSTEQNTELNKIISELLLLGSTTRRMTTNT